MPAPSRTRWKESAGCEGDAGHAPTWKGIAKTYPEFTAVQREFSTWVHGTSPDCRPGSGRRLPAPSQRKVGQHIHGGFTKRQHLLVRVTEQPTHRRYLAVQSQRAVRINLTDASEGPDPQDDGKDADAVELSVEELEDRIAPVKGPLKP